MLERTTIDSLGTGWVDNVPGPVSTGYQAQNTSSEAVRVGLDTISMTADSSMIVTIFQGGTIDENGTLYTNKETLYNDFSAVAGGEWFFYLLPQGLERSISYAQTNVGVVWDTAKNAYYFDGKRVLDLRIIVDTELKTVTVYDSRSFKDILFNKTKTSYYYGDLLNRRDLFLLNSFTDKETKVYSNFSASDDTGIFFDGSGGFLYSSENTVIRKLNLSDGTVATITPNGVGIPSGNIIGVSAGQSSFIGASYASGIVVLNSTGTKYKAVSNSSGVNGIFFGADNFIFGIKKVAKQLILYNYDSDTVSKTWNVGYEYSDIAEASSDYSAFFGNGIEFIDSSLSATGTPLFVLATVKSDGVVYPNGGVHVHLLALFNDAVVVMFRRFMQGTNHVGISYGGAAQMVQVEPVSKKIIARS
jgi:hypothetical protein